MSTKGLNQLKKKPDLFSSKAETQSLFITTPCFGNLVTVDFMQSMINTQSWTADTHIPWRFYWLGNNAIITEARNRCVAEFLNDNDHYSHLLFVDADVAFGVETLEKLLKADKDVAVAPYPNKSIDWAWQEFRITQDPEADYSKACLTFNVVFEDALNGGDESASNWGTNNLKPQLDGGDLTSIYNTTHKFSNVIAKHFLLDLNLN